MKGLPADDIDCAIRCREEFQHGSGLGIGGKCYCAICKGAFSRPEFFRYTNCASYLSIKYGHNRELEKYYATPHGRYYYC